MRLSISVLKSSLFPMDRLINEYKVSSDTFDCSTAVENTVGREGTSILKISERAFLLLVSSTEQAVTAYYKSSILN